MRVVGTLAALALSLAAFPALATTFTAGEFVTFNQGEWGETPVSGNVGALLENNYDSIFAPSDLLEVGIHGSAGFSIIFDNPDDLIAYLPSNGTAGALTADLLDPASSASGVFGGEVAALALNIAFSDASLLAHPGGRPVRRPYLAEPRYVCRLRGRPRHRPGDHRTRRDVGTRTFVRGRSGARRRHDPVQSGRDGGNRGFYEHGLRRRVHLHF